MSTRPSRFVVRLGKQPQRPAYLAFGRRRAAQRQQPRLQAVIDLQVVLACRTLAVQHQVQALKEKLLLDPVHLALAHTQHGQDIAGFLRCEGDRCAPRTGHI